VKPAKPRVFDGLVLFFFGAQ